MSRKRASKKHVQSFTLARTQMHIFPSKMRSWYMPTTNFRSCAVPYTSCRPPADLFIGFGGNAVREKVKAGADWFAMDFKDLIAKL